MPNVRMPDGTVVAFPDDMPETTIRGLIAQKFPREVAEMTLAQPTGQRSRAGHRELGTGDQGAIDAAGAYALNAVNAVPLAGPALASATKAAASVLPAITSDQSFGEVYDQMGRKVDQASQDHPIAATAGGVTGAVGGTLPLLRAAPWAFGLGKGGKIAQVVSSALSGATMNAADTGIRTGGDVEAMKGSGIAGGAMGLAAPILAPLIGKGVQAAAEKIQFNRIAKALGLDKEAAGFVRNAAQADALTPADARAALDSMGPDAMLLDLGPNLKGLAGGLASVPGEGKQVVRGAIASRDADANWRIRSALDDQLGPAPVPSRVIDRIERNQQAVQPQYREAFRYALPADTGMIAKYIENEAQGLRGEAQRGIQRIRSMLNRTGSDQLETNPGVLLETRKAVDGMLETVQDSNARNALQTARQAIDDTLANAAPRVKEADANYAELARQKEALQRGQTVLSSGREAPRPTELAQEFRSGALPQGRQIGPSAVPVRLREGARAEIERIVGTTANDRVALQRLVKGEGDWNRARLSTLFGKDKANAIIDVLDRERAFADTSNVITRNSETAARNAQQRELLGADDPGLGTVGGFVAGGVSGAARGAAVKGAERIVEALKNIKSDQVRGQIAKTLVSRNPVLDALLAPPVRMPVSQIDRVARALLLAAPERR